MNLLQWGLVGMVACLAIFVLWLFAFWVRLGRTQQTIRRAVELALKHLDGTPLTPAEQQEVDEFCRRGILRRVEEDVNGERTVLYRMGTDPVLAELKT